MRVCVVRFHVDVRLPALFGAQFASPFWSCGVSLAPPGVSLAPPCVSLAPPCVSSVDFVTVNFKQRLRVMSSASLSDRQCFGHRMTVCGGEGGAEWAGLL